MRLRISAPAFIRAAVREGRGHRLWLEIVIFLAVFLVASTLQSSLVGVPMFFYFLSSERLWDLVSQLLQTGDFVAYFRSAMELMTHLPDWLSLLTLVSTLATIGVCLIYCRLMEKRSFLSMGLFRRGMLKEYLLGFLLGAAMIAAMVGIGLWTGFYRLRGIAPTPAWGWIALFLPAYMIQGMSEEILCRGYLMTAMARRYALPVAVGVNALVFALLHLVNPGMNLLSLINIGLFGVLASVYMLRRGSIWGAAAIHSAWNFTLGNVFGSAVSGQTNGSSILLLEATEKGGLLHGGAFGAEGGLVVTVVLLLVLAILFFTKPRQREAAHKA